MSDFKKYSSNLYTYIKINVNQQKVVEVGIGASSLGRDIVERNEEHFETAMAAALATLTVEKVLELKKYAKHDATLRQCFDRVYQVKIIEANNYKVD